MTFKRNNSFCSFCFWESLNPSWLAQSVIHFLGPLLKMVFNNQNLLNIRQDPVYLFHAQYSLNIRKANFWINDLSKKSLRYLEEEELSSQSSVFIYLYIYLFFLLISPLLTFFLRRVPSFVAYHFSFSNGAERFCL